MLRVEKTLKCVKSVHKNSLLFHYEYYSVKALNFHDDESAYKNHLKCHYFSQMTLCLSLASILWT